VVGVAILFVLVCLTPVLKHDRSRDVLKPKAKAVTPSIPEAVQIEVAVDDAVGMIRKLQLGISPDPMMSSISQINNTNMVLEAAADESVSLIHHLQASPSHMMTSLTAVQPPAVQIPLNTLPTPPAHAVGSTSHTSAAAAVAGPPSAAKPTVFRSAAGGSVSPSLQLSLRSRHLLKH
jgi:hypothetical protein